MRYSQIFIMNTDGSGLRQLTHGRGGDAENPDITDDGNTIVFESNQDLRGENADGTVEVFVVNADGSGLMQITVGAPKIAGKREISADGSKIAFDSFADLTPPSNDDFSDEIFVFDLAGYLANGGAARSAYTLQLTDTDIDHPDHIRAEDAFEASISADGTWIAFSACINTLGTNPTLADAIFVVKSDGTNLTQLSFVNDIRHDARLPSITADGTAVMFTARADLVAGNNLDRLISPVGMQILIERYFYNPLHCLSLMRPLLRGGGMPTTMLLSVPVRVMLPPAMGRVHLLSLTY